MSALLHTMLIIAHDTVNVQGAAKTNLLEGVIARMWLSRRLFAANTESFQDDRASTAIRCVSFACVHYHGVHVAYQAAILQQIPALSG